MGVIRTSNFASQPRRPVRAVTLTVWATGLLLAGVLVWALAETLGLWQQTAQLEDHQVRLTEEVAALAVLAQGAPTAEQISQTAARTERFNLLTGPRTAPLAEVLAFLETSLPRPVRVSKLVYDVETGRLALALQAINEADLPPALRALEGSPLLDGVILERQLRLQQGTQNLVQYDIQATAL